MVEVVAVQAVKAVDGHGAGVDVPVAGAGVGDLPVSLQPEPHPLPSLGLENYTLRSEIGEYSGSSQS